MERFEKLISSMPVKEQAFTSKRDTWKKFDENHKSLIDKVFKGVDHVEVSRRDLFELAKDENIKEFIMSTIIWGYSSGMRGNHFQNIFDKINDLEEHLNKLGQNNGHLNWNEHLDFIDKIQGLGLSTYSKFLYFMGAKIDGYSALILDLRLIDVFQKMKNKKLFVKEINIEGFKEIENIRYDNAPDKYPLYLKYMDNVAKERGVKPDQLEMFLFTFGSNLKAVN